MSTQIISLAGQRESQQLVESLPPLDDIARTIVERIRAGNPRLQYMATPLRRRPDPRLPTARYCISVSWDMGASGSQQWASLNLSGPRLFLSGVEDLGKSLEWYGIDAELNYDESFYVVDKILTMLGPICGGVRS